MNPKRHSEIAEAVLNSICSSDKSATELKRAAATLRDMIRRSSAHWLDSGDDETSARSLCDWLADRIEKKLPTSVIRLGDGEGNFLPYPPALVAHRSADRRRVQADTWWGRVLLDTATSEEISRTLGTAIEEADLLGIPPVARVLLDLHQEAAVNKRHIRGLITVFHFLSTQQRRSDPITSCNFATDFSRFGLYPALFSSLARVSIISSHDLSGVLQSRFGLSVREHHAIPGEFRNRVETSSDQLRLPNPIFPERFRQLMERINPYRGEVYLVAAGMLGKLMCQRVKEKGGIAIDIGSQADSWMGAVTRIYSAREAT